MRHVKFRPVFQRSRAVSGSIIPGCRVMRG